MNFTFDWNEWFIIISASIFFSLFLLIRKHFPPAMLIIIWVFSIEYVASIDYFLLATPFKLYYFGDNQTYEFIGSFFHLLIYPSGAVLLLYGYDRWKLYGMKTVWYILFWTVFSVFFEWLCIKNGYLHYIGWKLYYSIPTYPVSAVLLLLLFHFTKKKLQELQYHQ